CRDACLSGFTACLPPRPAGSHRQNAPARHLPQARASSSSRTKLMRRREMPKANYVVWARGYGLVDSAKQTSEPGKMVNIRAEAAQNAAAAAEISSRPANRPAKALGRTAPEMLLPDNEVMHCSKQL